MMKHCFGADGKPDPEKMTQFMEHHNRGSRLDAIGWALFFVWVGIAWLLGAGIGVGLLGIAAIILGMQAVRRLLGVRVESFWVVIGLAITVFGLWDLFDVKTPLAPVILIVAGLALLFKVIRAK